MNSRLCKDCKWYKCDMWDVYLRLHQCHNPKPSVNKTSLVTGDVVFGNCSNHRGDERKCGAYGANWEKIDV